MFSDSEMKEIGLPMGPRKKLAGYLRQHEALKVLLIVLNKLTNQRVFI